MGGRPSRRTQTFVTQLARAKARGETQLMRRVEQAWRLRFRKPFWHVPLLLLFHFVGAAPLAGDTKTMHQPNLLLAAETVCIENMHVFVFKSSPFIFTPWFLLRAARSKRGPFWVGMCRRESEEHEPGTVRRGWQQAAASAVEERDRAAMFARVSDHVKALVRSQGGPGAPFTPTPTCRETTIPPHLFQVHLLRRLRQQLTSRVVHVDLVVPSTLVTTTVLQCPRVGLLSRRGFAQECRRTHLQRG